MTGEQVAGWCAAMERHLKALQAADDRDGLEETITMLRKHVSAWDTLYWPPPEPSYQETMPVVKRPWSSRTIAST